jgi:acyl-CoA synthetase (AMP-forming)/AMP-acid ligase II
VLPPSSDVDELDGSVGFPNIGVEVRLVDLEGNLVEGEGEGELQARSAYNMLGYWNNPEASAATIVDGWLRTGDLAARTQDGRYKIVGRLKEMYKSGGYNVYPREVETVIEEIPGVALAAVVGVADPVWQEVGIAYVIADDTLDADTILKHCRTRLANYKIPKRVFVHKELPLLPIGKVDKGALRNLYAEQPA